MSAKKYWIKRRDNPHTGVYYVAEGQLSKAAAKRHEKPIYGSNTMIPFDSEKEYLAEIERLESTGERFI